MANINMSWLHNSVKKTYTEVLEHLKDGLNMQTKTTILHGTFHCIEIR